MGFIYKSYEGEETGVRFPLALPGRWAGVYLSVFKIPFNSYYKTLNSYIIFPNQHKIIIDTNNFFRKHLSVITFVNF